MSRLAASPGPTTTSDPTYTAKPTGRTSMSSPALKSQHSKVIQAKLCSYRCRKEGSLRILPRGRFYRPLRNVFAGGVYGLHYACKKPNFSTATDCSVTFGGWCIKNGEPYVQNSTTFNYNVADTAVPQMGYAAGFLSQIYPRCTQQQSVVGGYCYNLTGSAASSTGAAVDLLIDDAVISAIVKVKYP
jgi:hypothetical protein